jgi:two-component system CheB/CheR fusion protein
LLGEQADIKGLREVQDLRLFDYEHELEPAEQPLQRASTSGKAVRSFEGRLRAADGGLVDVMVSAAPLFSESGKARGAIAAVTDVSERKHGEQQREILLNELQHRVKNVLSTVSALASRMLKSAPSLEQFSSSFLDRLRAMGRVHDLLSQRNWKGVELRALIESALDGHLEREKSALRLSGPSIHLRPGAASALGMVFHELSTNAMKYGALSVPGGRIEVNWKVDATDDLIIAWKEMEGPKVERPASEGFGTMFLQRCVEYELEGTVELHYDMEGLRCRIRLPLSPNMDSFRSK